jgi:hypothetical protein
MHRSKQHCYSLKRCLTAESVVINYETFSIAQTAPGLVLKAPLARRCAPGLQPRGGCASGSPSAQRG